MRFAQGLRRIGRQAERMVRRRLPRSVRDGLQLLWRGLTHRPPEDASDASAQASGAPRDRGTILIVGHDAEVGGAQQVCRTLARWLLERTGYEVKFAVMQGGGLIGEYARIAPVFDLSLHPARTVGERLREFAGDDVRAIVLNSVASGGFLRHWDRPTPVVACIHELTQLLKMYADNLALIRQRATTLVAGSAAVADALRGEFGCDDERVRIVHGFVEDDLTSRYATMADKRAAKEALGLDPDTMLVTACGVAHWRKSPEAFVEVAARVLARTSRPVRFIWVGHGPDTAECTVLARRLGIDAHVTFTGYRADIQPYLTASDVFLLPSKEDPFPLVCLYAGLALNPVVCFAAAGGTPELVARGGGRVVPFGDVDAMAEAALAYLDDPVARETDARALRRAVLERHTVATAGPGMLHWIREAAGLRPHVTVVVPNYNYERFLEERLDSLRRQTYQDFEVVLLDDRSTDGSVAVLEAWAATRAGTRVVVNDANGGSPFAQWLKGIDLARGELVWIAEADDSCEPDLLAAVVPAFSDRNVLLAYAKSKPIGTDGTVLGDYEPLYLDRIAPGRWSRAYVATDHEEANAGLGIANCIPNASSVVFRRFRPEAEFAAQLSGMRLCGDWLFYLRAMRGGLVSYCPRPLNLHRRHAATVTHAAEGTPRYFAEFALVRDYVAATYRLTAEACRRIAAFTAQDEVRFATRPPIPVSPATPRDTRLPAVLFVASDLSPGGGQMFIIRLANTWAQRGGRAVILNAAKFPDHPQVLATISPRVPVFAGPRADLLDLVRRFGIDLVHSAIWWADACVLGAAERDPSLPWVITTHGCHETLLDHPHVDPEFPRKVTAMLRRADAWVHTADKNERVFATYGRPVLDVRIENGVSMDGGTGLSRRRLGIAEGTLVVCLASRAIAEKGWEQAVEAVGRLRAAGRDVELLLIGEGPAADAVRRRAPPGVRQVDQVSNLQDYLAVADVVLLPSYFVGESLPLVLLEAMAVGKPVIATDVGGIPGLVGAGEEAAGLIVPLVEGRPDVAGLAAAIDGLGDPARREALGRVGRTRFETRYTLGMMVDRYEALYRSCIAARRLTARRAA